MLVQFLVHEGILNKSLAVIEDSVHLYSGNVLSEGCELALLNGADLALRIEYIDVDAFHTQKTVGNG